MTRDDRGIRKGMDTGPDKAQQAARERQERIRTHYEGDDCPGGHRVTK